MKAMYNENVCSDPWISYIFLVTF